MSYDGSVHTVKIGELTRDLPIFEVAPHVKIALLNILGDTEIVEHAADLLTARLPHDVDTIIVPEVKAIPLGHAVAVRSRLPYVVARKLRKPYMVNCLEAEVVSITTGKPQTLIIDGKDRHLVEGKRVVVVDDVISTGSTLRALRLLMERARATIVAEMAIFTEGDDSDFPTVISLGHLPIFTD
jgi:adenine phosphoribosyltransferase